MIKPRAAVGKEQARSRVLGRWGFWVLLAWVGLSGSFEVAAQTRLKLSSISPGTEKVSLVTNGDFQDQGTGTSTNTHPNPAGWTRTADMFADPSTNMVTANNGVVARALVNNRASVCQYRRNLSLEPATDYVLSAYLWNLGDSANHVTTVIDMNDVAGEPQVTLSYSDANADQGYFVYRSFNTSTTGTNLTLRLFYDSLVGSGAAAKYYPVGAQWDNLAVTKATDFVAPQPSGNLPPMVSISSPPDGTSIVFSGPPSLVISAAASDPDGTVAKVEFFAGGNKLGEATASPFSLLWSNFSSGPYQLTARATDNAGGTALSSAVAVTLTVPSLPSLSGRRSGANYTLSWPANLASYVLQCATNLAAPINWKSVNTSNQLSVSVPVESTGKFFRLALPTEPDPSTLSGKLLMGYQGWFACPNDGSPLNKWVHWFDTGSQPYATNLTVDFWPDVSELDPDELYPTAMTLADGSPAKVYAAWNQKTLVRHFKWMKDNHLDGVFLQRFTSELTSSKNLGWRNQVASNVVAGAEAYGRVFAMMYDISGQNEATLISTLTNDWGYLANTMHITNSTRYIRHRGRPVVAVWGFGFDSRTNTPDEALTIINFFHAAGCTVMGGVPTYWRTLSNDSQTDPAWANAYRAFDIISPWSVTRFSDTSGADNFKINQLLPDLTDCNLHGIDYMPVVFPGFSWHNLNPAYALNQIPRKGGTFYWRQVYNAISAHCTMLYGAMFDEMNEGTSMFKMVANANALPVEGTFVPLNTDGYTNLPSDWYLRLADQAGKMLRGEIPLQPTIPISP